MNMLRTVFYTRLTGGLAVYKLMPPDMTMKDSILRQLQIAKKNKGYSYKRIAEMSDGLFSERTVERVFKGQSPVSPERYEYLESILEVNRLFAGVLQGPADLTHVIVHEVTQLTREQQQLILKLCREMSNNHE